MNTSPGFQKLAAAAAHCRAYGLYEEATACDEAAQIIAQYLHTPDDVRQLVPSRDDQDQPLWVIRKDRSDSPRKIDFAMAAVLSWEARGDA